MKINYIPSKEPSMSNETHDSKVIAGSWSHRSVHPSHGYGHGHANSGLGHLPGSSYPYSPNDTYLQHSYVPQGLSHLPVSRPYDPYSQANIHSEFHDEEMIAEGAAILGPVVQNIIQDFDERKEKKRQYNREYSQKRSTKALKVQQKALEVEEGKQYLEAATLKVRETEQELQHKALDVEEGKQALEAFTLKVRETEQELQHKALDVEEGKQALGAFTLLTKTLEGDSQLLADHLRESSDKKLADNLREKRQDICSVFSKMIRDKNAFSSSGNNRSTSQVISIPKSAIVCKTSTKAAAMPEPDAPAGTSTKSYAKTGAMPKTVPITTSKSKSAISCEASVKAAATPKHDAPTEASTKSHAKANTMPKAVATLKTAAPKAVAEVKPTASTPPESSGTLNGILKRVNAGRGAPKQKRRKIQKFDSNSSAASKDLISRPYYQDSGRIVQRREMVSFEAYMQQKNERDYYKDKSEKLFNEVFAMKLLYEGKNPNPEMRELRKRHHGLYLQYEACKVALHNMTRKYNVETAKLNQKLNTFKSQLKTSR